MNIDKGKGGLKYILVTSFVAITDLFSFTYFLNFCLILKWKAVERENLISNGFANYKDLFNQSIRKAKSFQSKLFFASVEERG